MCGRLITIVASLFAVAAVFPASSWAEKPKAKVTKVNPGASAKELSSGKGDLCVYVPQDQNLYKVCNYDSTPETQSDIKSQIDGLK
jgi:hypothetical protein